MHEWYRQVQTLVGEIDECIRQGNSAEVTLRELARRIGYSEYHLSRKFREISGMQLRDYLRYRKLAFALKELRNTDESILDIALRYGFSSHEAFTRSFKEAYSVTPSEYRCKPFPVVLRTIIKPFDCYLLGKEEEGMVKSVGDVKVYLITIPAHKYLHIRNNQSIGYWDFWQKQSLIPGQDCETICGLLDSIPGKLDDTGGNENNTGSGQIMAFINEPEGRICSWGIPLAESYGVRLAKDYAGPVPPQMLLMDVPEGEYVVFEHGPFDYEKDNCAVEERIEQAMKDFDYAQHGCMLDLTPGRVFYFYHDPQRFWKYIRPIKRI